MDIQIVASSRETIETLQDNSLASYISQMFRSVSGTCTNYNHIVGASVVGHGPSIGHDVKIVGLEPYGLGGWRCRFWVARILIL